MRATSNKTVAARQARQLAPFRKAVCPGKEFSSKSLATNSLGRQKKESALERNLDGTHTYSLQVGGRSSLKVVKRQLFPRVH